MNENVINSEIAVEPNIEKHDHNAFILFDLHDQSQQRHVESVDNNNDQRWKNAQIKTSRTYFN